MFHMPMSSPMMTTMLGFCWADAGASANATAVRTANRMSKTFLVDPIECLPVRPSVSCIEWHIVEQEPHVRRGAGEPGSLRLQLPQDVHPRPIGELQPGQIENHFSPDLGDGAAQLSDFVAREPPVERQYCRRSRPRRPDHQRHRATHAWKSRANAPSGSTQ